MDEPINRPEAASDDALLIRAFQSEDNPKSAFNALVLKYQSKIFNLCYRFLGDYEEANDCAQETFLKVYRSLNSFRFDSAFSTWLYRIAVNTCKNKLVSAEYRYKKKMLRLDTAVDDSESDCKLEIKDESQSPAVELEKKERARLIQEAIDALAEDQKKVVILRDIELLSYEEIAKITGFNLGTVKSKLSRARQALCEKLRRLI
jgi:RNA polymerase sigma-70 factor (ECF subfamily)